MYFLFLIGAMSHKAITSYITRFVNSLFHNKLNEQGHTVDFLETTNYFDSQPKHTTNYSTHLNANASSTENDLKHIMNKADAYIMLTNSDNSVKFQKDLLELMPIKYEEFKPSMLVEFTEENFMLEIYLKKLQIDLVEFYEKYSLSMDFIVSETMLNNNIEISEKEIKEKFKTYIMKLEILAFSVQEDRKLDTASSLSNEGIRNRTFEEERINDLISFSYQDKSKIPPSCTRDAFQCSSGFRPNTESAKRTFQSKNRRTITKRIENIFVSLNEMKNTLVELKNDVLDFEIRFSKLDLDLNTV